MKQWVRKFDIPGLICAVFTLILFGISAIIKPTPLYVPPNDSNSSFPHPGTETIPTWLVIVLLAAIGLVTVIALYFLAQKFPKVFRDFNAFSAVWNLATSVAIANFIVNLLKNMVGRPRPDLYDLCGPNVTSDPASCPGISESDFNDQWRSWPSGHSSSAMAGFTYLAFFVQRTISISGPIGTLCASLYVLFALYVGSTRILNYKHHPDDVVAGFFIGFVLAYIIWQRANEDIYDLEYLKTEAETAKSENTDKTPLPNDPL